MSEVMCPECGNDALVGMVAHMTNTYRCDHCSALVRFYVDKPKHEARKPHPNCMIGRG